MNGLVAGRYKVTWAIRSALYANNDVDDDDYDGPTSKLPPVIFPPGGNLS